MVALVGGSTAPTLRETAEAREAERVSGAAAHPLVRKVLGANSLVSEAVHQDEFTIAGGLLPGRLGQDRGDQECERVMGAGWPLGACTRPRPTSWTTAML